MTTTAGFDLYQLVATQGQVQADAQTDDPRQQLELLLAQIADEALASKIRQQIDLLLTTTPRS